MTPVLRLLKANMVGCLKWAAYHTRPGSLERGTERSTLSCHNEHCGLRVRPLI